MNLTYVLPVILKCALTSAGTIDLLQPCTPHILSFTVPAQFCDALIDHFIIEDGGDPRQYIRQCRPAGSPEPKGVS